MVAMIFQFKIFAASLLLAAACGCVSQPNPSGVSVAWLLGVGDSGALETFHNMTRDDASLAKKIKFTTFGFVNARAMNTVESLASRPMDLQYRIDWLNDDGNVLPYDSVLWYSFTLDPGAVQTLSSPLPPVAAGYRLTVRRAP